MNNILSVDSSAGILSLTLQSGESVFENSRNQGLKHSENLLPMTEVLLKQAGLELKEIDLLVVSRGPGSFTGLRIGMATLKGISLALNIPLVSVSTLDAYATCCSFFDGVVVPVIDARKKCFYTAFYKKGQKTTEEMDISLDEIIKLTEGKPRILLTGPDAEKVYDKVKEDSRFILDPSWKLGKSYYFIEIALSKFEKRGADDFSQGPVYLRKSEAEIELDKRLAQTQ